MKQTIGVGIIARNSESTIRRCIKSFEAHVDQIVVVLAGKSTDKTAREAKKGSSKVELYDFEWIDDFSAARNFCFSKLNTDFNFWCDADDEIINAENLRKLAEGAEDSIGAVWLPYHYAVDEFQNPTTIYERERLLRAKYGWLWKSRLHETVSPLTECKFVRSDQVIIKHNHLAGAPRHERNFKLLNIMLKESPDDKRVWLYLGHQNFAARNFAESAEWYIKFGSDEGAVMVERYQALCYGCKALREVKDSQAVDVALMAVALCPEYKDAYLEMAHGYLMLGDYDKAIHWAKVSEVKELIKQPPAVIFINPLDYTFNKYALYSECYLKKGDFDTALAYLEKAYAIRPVPDVKGNISYISKMKMRNRVADSIKVLAVHLLDTREIVKLKSLLDCTPYWFRDLPDYEMLKSGADKYSEQLVDNPEIVANGKGVLVNIGNALDPKKTLAELDKKYEKVTAVCPMPSPDSKQINAYSQRDMEEIVMASEGRHLLNLQREESRIICEYENKELDGLKVRMFVGQGLEYWSPQTIKNVGCGGSETSAAWLSREFANKGCYPILYATDTQVWDGVVYRHHSNFSPNGTACHLFISSRVPDVLTNDIPAKQKYLWVHDISCFERLTPEIAGSIDAIVALSKWHAGHLKRAYPFLKDAEVIDLDRNRLAYKDNWTGATYFEDAVASKLPKIAIIGDGIDTERFKDKSDTRVSNRFIWCSSPDRGLEELLQMWPLVRKSMPDAELKIFYGWDYFDKYLFMPAQREYKERLLKLIKQDGVEWCGRVGQDQIARELMKADIMLYPPHDFRETYGIAFLEAQAAGVVCFYRQNGALGETIGDRGVPLSMKAKPEEIVQKINNTMANRELVSSLRDKGREYAMKRDWSVQAEKFLKLYGRLDNG